VTFFHNRDINRLAAHTTLHSLAWSFCGLFSAVFLLRQGVSVSGVFLAFAAILLLRLALRPLVLMVAPRAGLRRTLVLGTLLHALQSPMLAFVHGGGVTLAIFCVVAAIGQVFYWTAYHAYFAALGDTERRGSQVAVREVLSAVAGTLGPAAGGLVLAEFGAWPAFLTAFAIELGAILPLLHVSEPALAAPARGSLYESAKGGIWLFVSDGWITSSAVTAWSIIMFRAAGARYDTFGGLLAAAALAAALSGMLLGRFIDLGHARRLARLNAAILAGSLLLKSLCGEDPIAVAAVAVGTTLMGGLYIPALMTAVYNESKRSPCPLRFQFAAEGGWDVGGSLACLTCALLSASGLPLVFALLIALPVVPVQMRLLMASYERSGHPVAHAGDGAQISMAG
jgi:MFS family permease